MVQNFGTNSADPAPNPLTSTSTSGETFSTSAAGDTSPVSSDSASASSLGVDYAQARKTSSYFITAMPNNAIPYCSPVASIEEAYPFESSRLLPKVFPDPPLETPGKSFLAECKDCGKDGMTRIHYRHFTTRNVLFALIAPMLAPCLLTSAGGLNRYSTAEHKCASCGAKLASTGGSAGAEEKGGKKADEDETTRRSENVAKTTPTRARKVLMSGRRAREATFRTSGLAEEPQVQANLVEQIPPSTAAPVSVTAL